MVPKSSEAPDTDRNQIFESLYEELRSIATYFMARERSDHTLQPTALIHEAYLKLKIYDNFKNHSKTHFTAIATNAMRQVLIDYARRHNALKRQQPESNITFTFMAENRQVSLSEILAIHEALTRLENQSPNGARHARLIQFVFFGGMSMKEAAQELGISRKQAHRDWNWARTFLAMELSDEQDDTP